MVNRYIVFYWEEDEKAGKNLAEFEELEIAMDFVEFYRRRYPEKHFGVKGISYHQDHVTEGTLISKWEPIPREMLRDEIQNLLNWIAESVE